MIHLMPGRAKALAGRSRGGGGGRGAGSGGRGSKKKKGSQDTEESGQNFLKAKTELGLQDMPSVPARLEAASAPPAETPEASETVDNTKMPDKPIQTSKKKKFYNCPCCDRPIKDANGKIK